MTIRGMGWGGGGAEGGIIPLNSLTGARPRRVAQCVSFDAHDTKKGSGCSGTTGRSAEHLPFLVAVPSRYYHGRCDHIHALKIQ